MTLIKTSILTAISTIIKILSGLVINKVMAIYVGPGGLALVGQFRNFSSMLTTFSNGAITQGIIKYTAEYQDIDQKSKIFSTSLIIIKLLLDGGLIRNDLYSIIVASSIIFKFLVPVLFSNLLVKWKVAKK